LLVTQLNRRHLLSILIMKVIAFPHKPGKGGPGSFQVRFEQALINKGYQVAYAGDAVNPDLVFVVGGTKRLGWLIKMKLKGVPIVHRLDGLSWLHRRQDFRSLLFGEWGNLVFKFIQAFIATHVVYQSLFVKNWWDRVGWRVPKNYSIIHNGVDLEEFNPVLLESPKLEVICVEGTLDYSPYAVSLVNYISDRLLEVDDVSGIVLYGNFKYESSQQRLNNNIEYKGSIKREDLSGVYKNGIYLSLDINPACPNAVIEAIASGLPVVGYNTGALKEVVGEAGVLADFGSNQWGYQDPNFSNLLKAILEVVNNYEHYRTNALDLSSKFDLNIMVDRYIEIIKNLNEV